MCIYSYIYVYSDIYFFSRHTLIFHISKYAFKFDNARPLFQQDPGSSFSLSLFKFYFLISQPAVFEEYSSLGLMQFFPHDVFLVCPLSSLHLLTPLFSPFGAKMHWKQIRTILTFCLILVHWQEIPSSRLVKWPSPLLREKGKDFCSVFDKRRWCTDTGL